MNTLYRSLARLLCLSLAGLSLRAEVLPLEPLGPSSRRTGMAISEIMYHPETRSDGKNLEFLELYNSNPFQENISGWRLTGSIEYTFPSNTIVGPFGFLVVAAAPGDIQAVYGVTGVLGPWTDVLPDDSGSVQLLKRSGGIVLDLTYSDWTPWPLAADGRGHSLVLGRPSYGEDDARAWVASTVPGGSPGGAEPKATGSLEQVVFNEVLARPLSLGGGFVELYNAGTQEADLSGAWISVASVTNRFQIGIDALLPAGRWIQFSFAQLGFAPSPAGDVLFLRAADNPARIVHAVALEAQAEGVAIGRQPDGAEGMRLLASPTPGLANSPLRTSSVVLNEIFYHPPKEQPDGDYVELYNWSNQPVDVSDWRLVDGIQFTFPAGSRIPAGGYVVVAKDPQRFQSYQGSLGAGTLFGPFSGNLSGRGERLALARPELIPIAGMEYRGYVTVDEVTYSTGGKWGAWADGGGSSLELITPHSDHSLGVSWADSDESGKSEWTLIEHTGVLDMPHPSMSTADQLQVILFGKGETLIDDMEVLVNGQNRLRNPRFETNALNWVGQGTHKATAWQTNSGFNGGNALRVSASDRGDQVANRVRGALTPAIAIGTEVTLRGRARWLKGNTDLLLRLRSGMLEAPGRLSIPTALGTPGKRNSQARQNIGPAIVEVAHFPVLPPTNTPVRVSARVLDWDGLASVMLRYRIDPTNLLFDVEMKDDGVGADLVAGDQIYSGEIPGQRAGKLVAFRIEAIDRAAQPLKSVFPPAAPRRECLYRVGETMPRSTFGTYRFWLTQSNLNYWSSREKMSNEEVDATFVFGTNRIVYNAGARYAGSYYTVPTYDTPVGSLCGYDITLPADNPLLGEDHFTFDYPIRDDTNQREQLMYWFCEQYGLPNMYRRYVNLYVNGNKRGAITDDIQQPDGNTLREFFPEDSEGLLLKTDCWDEFADSGDAIGGNNCVLNSLEDFVTSDGERKLGRYRWNWRPRAVQGSAHDFTELFTLIDAMTAPGTNAFIAAVNSVVDIENWMRTFAMNDLASFWDAFGNPNAKNTYLYKPERDGWKLYSWDFDVGLGVFNDPVDSALFPTLGDSSMNRIYATPALLRPYWTAIQEAVDSFFISGPGTAVDAILDSKYAAFRTNSVSFVNGNQIKTWINQRRAYLTNELRKVSPAFAVTSPKGSPLLSSTNRIFIRGTASPVVNSLQVNGRVLPIQWSTVSNWNVEVLLVPGDNALVVQGFDRVGRSLPTATATVNISYTGSLEVAREHVGISEIMFLPLVPRTEFIELYNNAERTTFDLSGWRVEGVDFVFPTPTFLSPGEFLVVVKDRVSFGKTYGWHIPIAGEFAGNLNPFGETLKLVEPSPSNSVVDLVTYDDEEPWPARASRPGASIQLIDPTQDHRRPGNWAAWQGEVSASKVSALTLGSSWRYEDSGALLPADWKIPGFDDSGWNQGPGVFYNTVDALTIPKTTLLNFTNAETQARVITHYFRTQFTLPDAWGLTKSRLGVVVDDGAAFYLNGQEIYRRRLPAGNPGPGTLANATVTRAVLESPVTLALTNLIAGDNLLAVEVHQSASNSTDVVFGLNLFLFPTPSQGSSPGEPNRFNRSLPAFPGVWLSEVQPQNVTGLADGAGERDPWVELYNSSATAVDVGGMYLSDDPNQLQRWKIPASTVLGPGQYRLVWLDGQMGQNTLTELHASFRIGTGDGVLILSRDGQSGVQIVDSLRYRGVGADESYGRFPADAVDRGQRFAYPTPSAQNSNASRPAVLWINEWLAGNGGSLADPADGDFEDWFEIYNAESTPVDLSSYTLTDTLSAPGKFVIPAGVTIPARGYLLVWADEETSQTAGGGDLHVNFKLSGGGEQIGLFAPDGRRVDAVLFGGQTDDVSQGRSSDGAEPPYVFFAAPTPRAANQSGPVHPAIQIVSVESDASGAVTVTWSARTGGQYRVLSLDDLGGAVWTVAAQVTATGVQGQYRDVEAAQRSRRFYRIEWVSTP
jgi:hypothetical protein